MIFYNSVSFVIDLLLASGFFVSNTVFGEFICSFLNLFFTCLIRRVNLPTLVIPYCELLWKRAKSSFNKYVYIYWNNSIYIFIRMVFPTSTFFCTYWWFTSFFPVLFNFLKVTKELEVKSCLVRILWLVKPMSQWNDCSTADLARWTVLLHCLDLLC